MSTHTFKAGAAKLDITPALGTVMNGDFVNHYAQRIHSRLFVKVLVLSNNGSNLAFVVVDICMMQRDFVDHVKAEIYKKIGIEKQNVLISSTHTHGAPSIAGLLLASLDLVYRNKLASQIVDAVAMAIANLTDAKFAHGSAQVPEHVLCRRYEMEDGFVASNPVTGGLDRVKTNPGGAEDKIIKSVAPVDPEVSFIAIKSTDEQWISLIANYSLHYVGDWPDGTITADYFGEFAEAVKSNLQAGDDFIAMMTNGTSGDVNIWDFLNPDRYPKAHFEKSKLIGKEVADKLTDVISQLSWDNNPSLNGLSKDVFVNTRKPSKEELPKFEKIVAEASFETITQLNKETLTQIYAREQLLLNEYPDEIDFPIQALKIGDCVIGALGGEFFSETGLKLKNAALNRYFTITMANGYVGYVPPKHEIERGGYETWRCRTSYLQDEAEDIIRKELEELITVIK